MLQRSIEDKTDQCLGVRMHSQKNSFKTAERQLDLGYSTTLSGEETSYHLRKSAAQTQQRPLQRLQLTSVHEYLQLKAK